MDRYISIGEAASLLGVCVATLRRWDNDNKLVAKRTLGKHRRYKLTDILEIYHLNNKNIIDKTICYARVSSHEQKPDLIRQHDWSKPATGRGRNRINDSIQF